MNPNFTKTLRRTLRSATKLVPPRRVAELTKALQKGWADGVAQAMDAVASTAQSAKPSARTGTAQPKPPFAYAPPMPPMGGRATAPGGMEPGTFSNSAGARNYKVFVPEGSAAKPRPLVVMLHGCTQDPDDFARGTRANEVGAEHGAVVLYPAQAQSANAHRCWNWFQPNDQQRGQGEPSLIAEMTRHVMAKYNIDPRRVYVAGLSAGGAMATTMATTYPDVFAALGVHSGLPHGAAHDVMSALAAMRQGPAKSSREHPVRVPTIVFHGDGDSTVHPCNGAEIVARFQEASATKPLDWVAEETLAPRVGAGQVPGGQRYTHTQYPGKDGDILVEHWLVHGAGHAWSGGDPSGSYTDPKGPDATREMFRFFLEHPQPSTH